MKRAIAVFMMFAVLVSICACTGNTKDYETEGYKNMFDAAVRLPREFSRELLEKVLPPSEIDFYIGMYQERDRDYMQEMADTYSSMVEEYSEKYGEDFVLEYSVVKAVEKDEDGIEQYKNYDSHYFNTYNVNTDKIQAVTFVTVNLHIHGSKGEFEREKTLQCFCIDGNWYSFYGAMLPTKL